MPISLELLKEKADFLEQEIKDLKIKIRQLETGKVEEPTRTEIKQSEESFIQKQLRKIQESTGVNTEVTIGGFVIGLLGALAVIIASGWFIKFAIEKRWLNESARIVTGIISGSLSIMGSWILAKKKFRVLPEVVYGTGTAIMYLAIFSAYHFYSLLGGEETLLYLFLLCLASTFIAKTAGSQFLYIFSILGAFLAPILISSGENSYRFLFTYLTILNLIYLYMSKKFSWKITAYIVLTMNYIIYSAWSISSLKISSFLIPFIFITILFNIFMCRYLFILQRKNKVHITDHTIIIINILLYTSFGHFTFYTFYNNFVSHFYLLTALFIIIWQFMYYKAEKEHQVDATTILLIGLAPLLITGTAIITEGPFDIIAAISSCGMISLMGSYRNRKKFLLASTTSWAVIILILIFNYTTRYDDHLLIFNSRFLIFLMSSLFLCATFYLQRHNKKFWIYGFAALFLVILASLFESHDFFLVNRQVRLLSYTFIIFAYAIIFIVPGFKYSNPALRFTGLALIGIVIIKFYLYDIWVLKTIIRIISGFALGTCLILTAIFYQKFKEKVLNIMFSKSILFILISISITAAANAEPVRTKSFKYYKDVIINNNIQKDQIYGVIHLDEDFYKYTSGYDLRVVYKNNGLPYFLTEYKIKTKKAYKVPKIIFEKKTREDSTYILELPMIPENSEYTELQINPITSANYEINMDVSASKDPSSWRGIGSHFIYRYSNSKKNIIKFKLQERRYIRIKTDSKIKLNFPGAAFLPKQKKEYIFNVPIEEIQKTYNTDRKATVYYFKNENRRRINRITLKFSDERFSRKFEIQIKDGKKYRFFMEGMIVQHKNTTQIIDLPYTTNAQIKIFIMNGDNKELTLESFSVTGLKEVCIFEIPEAYDDSSIRLYYGNRYMQKAKYDIIDTHDDNLKSVNLKTGKHIKNSEFSYSVLEPPISSWIIRILFICSLLGLLYPSYMITKKFVEDVGKE